jgi:two-component system, sensor histidine kinase
LSLPCEKVEQSQDDLVGKKVIDSHCHVLVVEDNLLNQKVEKLMLEELGCVVDVSSNGIEAMDYFTTRRYDLVFMDIGLPEMDGFEITKRFREIERLERLESTPIVALTAHAFLDDGAGCRDAGMNDILLKPASTSQLDAVLKQWCPKHQLKMSS